ncbi:MAG TPA: O-antigen ligase family protein, partial [Blastocatellia bacterium]|nr:O-antigen ligase family protein [Blastocatellia bacterium]
MFDKFIYFALLALLAATPLPYAAVEGWSIALWEICIFGLVGLWALSATQQGAFKISFNPLVWPMLGLLAVAVVQVLPLSSAARATISFSPFATTQFAFKLFASICFLLLFATFVNTDERRGMAVKTIIAACAIVAFVGISQRYAGKFLWQRGTFGPFVNRNHFAGFLEMGVGLAGGLLLGRAAKREWMLIYGGCALLMCAGIGLSASRGGVLALAAELMFLALLGIPTFFSNRNDKSRRASVLVRAAATLLIGLGAVAGAILLTGSEGLFQNFSQIQTETEGKLPAGERFSRRDIWSATTQMVKDHPLLGVGLGAFQFAYTRYDQSTGAQRVEQSHNDYLQVLADAGLIGGALMLAFVVLLFAKGFSAVGTHDRKKRAIVMGALTGCFA